MGIYRSLKTHKMKLGLLLPLATVFADDSNFLDSKEASDILLSRNTRAADYKNIKKGYKFNKVRRECTKKRCGQEEFSETFENTVSKKAKSCLSNPFVEAHWTTLFKEYYLNCICPQGDQTGCQGTRESREICYDSLLQAMDDTLSGTILGVCDDTKCKEKASANSKKCSEMYTSTLAGYFRVIVGRKNKLDRKFAQVEKLALKYDRDNSNRGTCPLHSDLFRMPDGSCDNPKPGNEDVGAH